MLQIKVFTADTVQEIESKVNEWLTANSKAEIIQIVQSESGTTSDDWTATITLLYKEAAAAKTSLRDVQI